MRDGVSDIACGASPGPAESPGRLRAQSLRFGLGFGNVKVRKCKSHLGRRMMVSDRQAHNLTPPGLASPAGNHLRRVDCPRGPRAARNDTLVATCESLRWCRKRSVFEYSRKRLGYRTTLSHLLKSPTTLVRSFSVCSARSPSAATQILRLRAALSTRFFAAWSCCAADADRVSRMTPRLLQFTWKSTTSSQTVRLIIRLLYPNFLKLFAV